MMVASLQGSLNKLEAHSITPEHKARIEALYERFSREVEQESFVQGLDRVTDEIVAVEKILTQDFLSQYLAAHGVDGFRRLTQLLTGHNPMAGYELLKSSGLVDQALLDNLSAHSGDFRDVFAVERGRKIMNYIVSIWRHELPDHIIAMMREAHKNDRSPGTLGDPAIQGQVVEGMLAGWTIDAADRNPRAALRSASRLPVAALWQGSEQAIIDGMTRAGVTARDLATVASDASVFILIGSAMQRVSSYMLQGLLVDHVYEHAGVTYAMMHNGCVGNLVVIDPNPQDGDDIDDDADHNDGDGDDGAHDGGEEVIIDDNNDGEEVIIDDNNDGEEVIVEPDEGTVIEITDPLINEDSFVEITPDPTRETVITLPDAGSVIVPVQEGTRIEGTGGTEIDLVGGETITILDPDNELDDGSTTIYFVGDGVGLEVFPGDEIVIDLDNNTARNNTTGVSLTLPVGVDPRVQAPDQGNVAIEITYPGAANVVVDVPIVRDNPDVRIVVPPTGVPDASETVEVVPAITLAELKSRIQPESLNGVSYQDVLTVINGGVWQFDYTDPFDSATVNVNDQGVRSASIKKKIRELLSDTSKSDADKILTIQVDLFGMLDMPAGVTFDYPYYEAQGKFDVHTLHRMCSPREWIPPLELPKQWDKLQIPHDVRSVWKGYVDGSIDHTNSGGEKTNFIIFSKTDYKAYLFLADGTYVSSQNFLPGKKAGDGSRAAGLTPGNPYRIASSGYHQTYDNDRIKGVLNHMALEPLGSDLAGVPWQNPQIDIHPMVHANMRSDALFADVASHASVRAQKRVSEGCINMGQHPIDIGEVFAHLSQQSNCHVYVTYEPGTTPTTDPSTYATAETVDNYYRMVGEQLAKKNSYTIPDAAAISDLAVVGSSFGHDDIVSLVQGLTPAKQKAAVPLLYRASRGSQQGVKELQKLINAPTIDGTFGDATYGSLLAWQTDQSPYYGTSSDGTILAETSHSVPTGARLDDLGVTITLSATDIGQMPLYGGVTHEAVVAAANNISDVTKKAEVMHALLAAEDQDSVQKVQETLGMDPGASSKDNLADGLFGRRTLAKMEDLV